MKGLSQQHMCDNKALLPTHW